MSTMTLAELKARAVEVFSSIIVFCPNFPAAAQTNTEKKFEQLIAILDSVSGKVRGEDAKQWLRICLSEVQQSRKHYDAGGRKKGMDLMQRAQEHFKQAFSQKPKVARFVAGLAGPTIDSENGFPQ